MELLITWTMFAAGIYFLLAGFLLKVKNFFSNVIFRLIPFIFSVLLLIGFLFRIGMIIVI